MADEKQSLLVSLGLHGCMCLTVCMFSGFHVIGKYTFKYMHPVFFAILRILICQPYHLTFCLCVEGRKIIVPRSLYPKLALLGFLGMFMNQVFYVMGLNFSNPVISAVIIAGGPIFLTIIETCLGHEKLTFFKAGAILTAFAGVLVVIQIETVSFTSQNSLGILFQMLATGSYVIYLILLKPVLNSYPFTILTFWNFFFGLLYTLPLLLPYSLISPSFTEIEDPIAYGGLLYGGLVASGLAYSLLTFANKRIQPVVVSAYSMMHPPVTAFLSYLMLDESLTLRTGIGSCVTIIGLAALAYAKHKDAQQRAEKQREMEKEEEAKARGSCSSVTDTEKVELCLAPRCACARGARDAAHTCVGQSCAQGTLREEDEEEGGGMMLCERVGVSEQECECGHAQRDAGGEEEEEERGGKSVCQNQEELTDASTPEVALSDVRVRAQRSMDQVSVTLTSCPNA